MENVSTVMSNMLKVQTRLETVGEKLESLVGGDEDQKQRKPSSFWMSFFHHALGPYSSTIWDLRSTEKINQFRSNLLTYHDELADLKSYFDGQGNEAFDGQNPCCNSNMYAYQTLLT